MAARTIYSCDWCGADSPLINHVGELWRKHGDEWLCEVCCRALGEAFAKAKAARRGMLKKGEGTDT